MPTRVENPPPTTSDILAIERPDSSLLTYYLVVSLAGGPFLPLVLLPLFFRYYTMRYRISDEGVSMRWGGRGSLVQTWSMIWSRVSPLKGRCNVRVSYRVTPSE